MSFMDDLEEFFRGQAGPWTYLLVGVNLAWHPVITAMICLVAWVCVHNRRVIRQERTYEEQRRSGA